jgi:hypothetical protein
MAQTIADYDGQKTPYVCPDQPHGWPVVGELLYRLNVNRFMVRKMALGHVYAESSSLSEARFEEKAGCDTRVGSPPFFDPLCCRGT